MVALALLVPAAFIEISITPSTAIAQTGGGGLAQSFSFISIIGLLWFMPLFKRRKRVRKSLKR